MANTKYIGEPNSEADSTHCESGPLLFESRSRITKSVKCTHYKNNNCQTKYFCEKDKKFRLPRMLRRVCVAMSQNAHASCILAVSTLDCPHPTTNKPADSQTHSSSRSLHSAVVRAVRPHHSSTPCHCLPCY